MNELLLNEPTPSIPSWQEALATQPMGEQILSLTQAIVATREVLLEEGSEPQFSSVSQPFFHNLQKMTFSIPSPEDGSPVRVTGLDIFNQFGGLYLIDRHGKRSPINQVVSRDASLDLIMVNEKTKRAASLEWNSTILGRETTVKIDERMLPFMEEVNDALLKHREKEQYFSLPREYYPTSEKRVEKARRIIDYLRRYSSLFEQGSRDNPYLLIEAYGEGPYFDLQLRNLTVVDDLPADQRRTFNELITEIEGIEDKVEQFRDIVSLYTLPLPKADFEEIKDFFIDLAINKSMKFGPTFKTMDTFIEWLKQHSRGLDSQIAFTVRKGKLNHLSIKIGKEPVKI